MRIKSARGWPTEGSDAAVLAVFYASINLGSVFVPRPGHAGDFWLRAAFAVPAVLLAAALAVFIGGRRKYTMLPPREGGVNVPAALWRACRGSQDDDARELRSIGEVMVLLPVFWMLYDQQGSIWVVQASEMKNFKGKLQPETMGVINPVLILLLLPFLRRVSTRMERRRQRARAVADVAGMVVASALVVAGLLDLG